MRKRSYKFVTVALSLFLILAGVSQALAAEGAADRGRIAVYGEAEIEVDPDQATVVVAVVTRASNAEKAARENSEQTNKLLAAIKKFGIKDSSVVTGGYHIYPIEYDKRREFQVYNRLEVTVDDLSSIGELIDVMVSAGANSVESVMFTASDAEDAKMKVLGIAIEQAGKKAKAMTEAAGLKLGEIVSITEEFGSYTPSIMEYGSALAVSRDAATMIKEEKIKISARVKVEYAIMH